MNNLILIFSMWFWKCESALTKLKQSIYTLVYFPVAIQRNTWINTEYLWVFPWMVKGNQEVKTRLTSVKISGGYSEKDHLFSSRTQQLSFSALIILGGRPPGNVSRCRSLKNHPWTSSRVISLTKGQKLRAKLSCILAFCALCVVFIRFLKENCRACRQFSSSWEI